MNLNKNKAIRKGFIFSKKRFPVLLTLSNGLFIHLLGCNAHQVKDQFATNGSLSLKSYRQSDFDSFSDKKDAQQTVIDGLYNVYKILYKKIHGCDVDSNINKEPEWLLKGIEALKIEWDARLKEQRSEEQDSLTILFRRLYELVTEMRQRFDLPIHKDTEIQKIDNLYNTVSVIQGLYNVYIILDQEIHGFDGLKSNKNQALKSLLRLLEEQKKEKNGSLKEQDSFITLLSRLYKGVTEIRQTLHGRQNKELAIQKNDNFYKTLYKTVHALAIQNIDNFCKVYKTLDKAVQGCKNPKLLKNIDNFYKIYKILYKEITPCHVDVVKLNRNQEPESFLKAIQDLTQIGLKQLKEPDLSIKKINDFVKYSHNILACPKDGKYYSDWQEKINAVYGVLGANIAKEPERNTEVNLLKNKLLFAVIKNFRFNPPIPKSKIDTDSGWNGYFFSNSEFDTQSTDSGYDTDSDETSF